jgi:hypothetical protein
MASEIVLSVSLRASKSGATVSASASDVIDMTGDDMMYDTQVIGTSAEALTWGEITGAPKYIFLQNLDSTNFVTVGFTNPPTEMKMLAGECLLIPPTTATIYAKADTAACRVVKCAMEA